MWCTKKQAVKISVLLLWSPHVCNLFYIIIFFYSISLHLSRHNWCRQKRANLTATGIRPWMSNHDDVTKWKHFPRYWPFVREIHRPPHKDQWRGALMFSLICAWINGWINNGKAGDLGRHRTHYDVTVMIIPIVWFGWNNLSMPYT